MSRTHHRLSLSFSFSLGVSVLFLVCLLLWLLLKPGSPLVFKLGDDLGQTLGGFVGIAFCFAGIWQKQQQRYTEKLHPTWRWVPYFFALGILGQSIGQAIFTYHDLKGLSPFPSLADLAFLSSYPLYLLGVLLLPTRPLSGLTRGRIFVESLTMLMATWTLAWYFILGPTLIQGTDSLLAKWVGTAYPAFDLILIGCIFLLATRSFDPSLRLAIALLCLSFFSLAIADSAFDYMNLQNNYVNGPLDLGWPLSYLLLGLATQSIALSPALHTYSALQADPAQEEKIPLLALPLLWRILLPYIFSAIVIALVLYSWNTRHSGLIIGGTTLGGVLLVVLIFFRQIITTRETHHLNEELRRLNDRLQALATTDPLTGLPNHRSLITRLDQLLELTRQHAQSCSILFLDLDHFKALNDGYGHAAGDVALKEFAGVVQSCLRPGDSIGRWGGEEFITLLPTISHSDLTDLAEQIRHAVATHSFHVGGGLSLTCSLGAATFPTHAHERESLVHAADQAMYGAKRLGRNQVRLADDPALLALQDEAQTAGGREEAALLGCVEALAHLVDVRDGDTATHSTNVSSLLLRLALHVGIPGAEAQMIAMAGKLHDVGKITVPDRILLKSGPLSEEELLIIRRHPEVGADVVSCIPALKPLAPIIRAHHERWDGQGYPHGLRGETIPYAARLLSVVDAYVVMTDGRSYQMRCSPQEALHELQRCAGSQFDPKIVEAFISMIGHPSALGAA